MFEYNNSYYNNNSNNNNNNNNKNMHLMALNGISPISIIYISHHTVSYHTVSYHTVSYHAVPCIPCIPCILYIKINMSMHAYVHACVHLCIYILTCILTCVLTYICDMYMHTVKAVLNKKLVCQAIGWDMAIKWKWNDSFISKVQMTKIGENIYKITSQTLKLTCVGKCFDLKSLIYYQICPSVSMIIWKLNLFILTPQTTPTKYVGKKILIKGTTKSEVYSVCVLMWTVIPFRSFSGIVSLFLCVCDLGISSSGVQFE